MSYIGQLSWLIYTVAGVIGGRTLTRKDEQHDVFDGEMASRVFHLMAISNEVLKNVRYVFIFLDELIAFDSGDKDKQMNELKWLYWRS